ncbi:small, acid-soluble spore protein L [Peribacillus sp. SCS-155]
MSKNRNRGTAAFSGVNPQGYTNTTERVSNPKSELENKAKKENTRK